jgi:hypothetical protein
MSFPKVLLCDTVASCGVMIGFALEYLIILRRTILKYYRYGSFPSHIVLSTRRHYTNAQGERPFST